MGDADPTVPSRPEQPSGSAGYLVTGGTGLIGRHLVALLLSRTAGPVHVCVRSASVARLRLLASVMPGGDRVVPVVSDLTEPGLGVDPLWVQEHAGRVDHLFHLAALYDMTTGERRNEQLNVGGTREALALAAALGVGCFHHVSSVAVAGDHVGHFDETMFDEGQGLPSPYHRTKHAAERLVREQVAVPWRVYRPSVVVGHSQTGVTDKVDGPYYFFPTLKRMRDGMPQWAPLLSVDLGDTNIVPVDYVAAGLDAIAHRPGLDGRTFHLVNPTPQPVVDVINAVASAANAPRLTVPLSRDVVAAVPGLSSLSAYGAALARRTLEAPGTRLVLRQTLGRLGIPPEVLAHLSFGATFASRATEHELRDSGVSCPPLESYAPVLWDHWEQHLDPSVAQDRGLHRLLAGRTVVITGGSSGIGRATALRVAQAGATAVLVARGQDGLDAVAHEIALLGGRVHTYACDLSDMEAIDTLAKQIATDHETVDVVVNNAGRSIRRSLKLSYDRFHDFERTMAVNYFGAIRLVMGLAPQLSASDGHVVNISSIGVQTNPPRFSAYVASKAALDAWARVVASELIGDGVTFTTIHMPLVNTPMIAPTKIYDAFPTITPAQAADLVLRAIQEQPHEINTLLGTAGEIAHAISPQTMFRVMHLAFQIFPDSAAARGDDGPPEMSREQVLLARVLKGVHW